MDQAIKKILKANYVDGIFHTHVSLITPKGKFQFNRQILEEFWQAYCTLIENDPSCILGIAEKPQQYLPVIVDVDLRIKDEGDELPESLYNTEQLKTIVEIYQTILRQIVENCTEDELVCVVLEKKMYQKTKNEIVYLSHGIHLSFPYIFMNKVDQEVHLIPRVQEQLTNNRLFANLGIEDSGSVIDKVCCKVPWLLYGSRKSEEQQPYKVTKVYNTNLQEVPLEKAFASYQLFNNREQQIQIKDRVDHYLPRILSIIPYGRSSKEIKKGIISPIKEKLKREKKSSANYRKMTVEESLATARKLLPMVADYRATERNEWMTIGWCLYNISEGHPDGLDLWCEFSSRCEEKYDENVCIYQWERMTRKDLGVGTLRYYASVDNPEEYKKYKNELTEKHILTSLDGSHNDVAKALYAEYGDEFVCASVSNRAWYQYTNHRWEQIEDGTFLREKISGKIVDKYTEGGKQLLETLKTVQDKGNEAMLHARLKQINKMVSNLKSATYKNNVMTECAEVFYNPKFKERLDADAFLIAFKNGVYDLRQNMFRPGRPEDYLSKFMPINYAEFAEDDERIQDVYTFLEQVFPDKSVRKYFLDVSSDIFVGGNHEKIVVFWTGEGDNGKSVTQKFFDLMLGKLSIKLNTNIITGKKPSAGSAFADLARAGGGVRLAVLEEPDSDEMINTGIFKHLSGNDTFYARDLFEKGKDAKEINPLFKLIFVCVDENTQVSLSSGISLSIKNLYEHKNIFSWDRDKNKLINTQQRALINKGVQKCLSLTLLDGRKISCTPNHKFLTEDNDWIEAQNIIPFETKLKMSLTLANCDDIYKEYVGKIIINNVVFDLQNKKEKLILCSLFRIVGYGEITKDMDEVDVESLHEDMSIFSLNFLKDIEAHEDLPLFLIREYLAGYFCKNSLITEEKVKLINIKNNILNLLKKFDITIDDNYSEYLLNRREVILFAQNIGFRYDMKKSCQLSLISSFSKYKDNNIDIDFESYKNMLNYKNNHEYSMTVLEITDGGDKNVYDINVTEPYSNFVANGIITHNCNKLPRIKAADKAVFNRIRVIPFESTFCRPDNPAPETYEEQLRQKRFPMDKQFGKKIPCLVEAFTYILLQHRLKILNTPRMEPDKVRAATEIYRKQNDIYKQFIDEVIAEDKSKTITLIELYSLFKEWYKDSLPNHTLPVKNEIEEYFTKVWGAPDAGKKWKGYRRRTLQDDVEAGEAIILTEEDLIEYKEEN